MSQNFKVKNGLDVNGVQIIAANGQLTGPAVTQITNITNASSDTWVRNAANSSYAQANTATILAQAAFDTANTGGTGTDSLTIDTEKLSYEFSSTQLGNIERVSQTSIKFYRSGASQEFLNFLDKIVGGGIYGENYTFVITFFNNSNVQAAQYEYRYYTFSNTPGVSVSLNQIDSYPYPNYYSLLDWPNLEYTIAKIKFIASSNSVTLNLSNNKTILTPGVPTIGLTANLQSISSNTMTISIDGSSLSLAGQLRISDNNNSDSDNQTKLTTVNFQRTYNHDSSSISYPPHECWDFVLWGKTSNNSTMYLTTDGERASLSDAYEQLVTSLSQNYRMVLNSIIRYDVEITAVSDRDAYYTSSFNGVWSRFPNINNGTASSVYSSTPTVYYNGGDSSSWTTSYEFSGKPLDSIPMFLISVTGTNPVDAQTIVWTAKVRVSKSAITTAVPPPGGGGGK